MAPVLTFVTALAAVVVASGQAVPSVGTATAGGGSLRGGARKLQEGMCNFIGCPGGYTPIPDAMNVMCNSDPCEVSQCCEAFCSYHPCPNNFIPIVDAGITMCPVSGCTDDLCCVDGTMGTEDNTPDDGGMATPTPSPVASMETSMIDDC